jgi:hypothetical protein
MTNEFKLGVYCHPDAVAMTPDYAKRLVEEAGVDYFILRSGYGLGYAATMQKAAEIVRGMGVNLSLMVGSWWGGTDRPVENLPSKSWESKNPMDMPGSPIDALIIEKFQSMCNAYKPDSLCVTHARYRHPAYIDGIFDEGSRDAEYQARMIAAGIPRRDVLDARAAWEQAMGAMGDGAVGEAALLKASEAGLIGFLCELSQSDAVKRLAAFRRSTVRSGLLAFRKAVTDCGVSFGANAYAPWGAGICGQDYDGAYAEACDFVQPLLCYMEWHRYEPIAAWGRYLHKHGKVGAAVAIEAAKNLLGLGGAVCPDSFEGLDTCAEGSDECVYSIVSKELGMCAPYVAKPYKLQPVLRGMDWGWDVTDRLVSEARAQGIDSFIFMGCDYLSKGSAPSINPSLPLSGWT